MKYFFQQRDKKWLLIIAILLMIIIAMWLTLAGRHKQTPDVYVDVAPVAIKAMPVIFEAPGNVEAAHTVTIIPQVTGIIKNVAIINGQNVTKGQLLFQIDPAPFQAALQQAQAVLKKDQATLSQNQADAKRFQALAKQEYVTKQQAEQAQTTANAQMALVAADLAQVNQAAIQLSYTDIHSPLTGKAGVINVKVGDLVVANSTQGLVTINQMTPIWIDFNVPQDKLMDIVNAQNKGALQVKVMTGDDSKLLTTAKLFFIDNTVNQQTGTVLLKAASDDPLHQLWPGQMVIIQLVIAIEPNAVVIPIDAVQLDQQGSYVYKVVDGIAKVQYITVSRNIGDEAVIAKGLQAGDTVITTISPDLQDGSSVQINDGSQNSGNSATERPHKKRT